MNAIVINKFSPATTKFDGVFDFDCIHFVQITLGTDATISLVRFVFSCQQQIIINYRISMALEKWKMQNRFRFIRFHFTFIFFFCLFHSRWFIVHFIYALFLHVSIVCGIDQIQTIIQQSMWALNTLFVYWTHSNRATFFPFCAIPQFTIRCFYTLIWWWFLVCDFATFELLPKWLQFAPLIHYIAFCGQINCSIITAIPFNNISNTSTVRQKKKYAHFFRYSSSNWNKLLDFVDNRKKGHKMLLHSRILVDPYP